MARTYLLYACISFAIGVWVQTFPVGAVWVIGCCVCVACGIGYGTHISSRRFVYLTFWCVCSSAFITGVFMCTFASVRFAQTQGQLHALVSDVSSYIVHVVDDVDERTDAAVADVRVTGYITRDGARRTLTPGSLVRLYAPRTPPLHYADTYLAAGKIVLPEGSSSSTIGAPFDYAGYLRAQGVVGEMHYARLTAECSGAACAAGTGERLFGFLLSIKHMFKDAVRTSLREPYAALALGVTIGEKHGLEKRDTDTFTRAGLVHVVVLSGYNIALVISLIFFTLRGAPRTLRYAVGSVAAIVFVLATGASSTALRALGMGLIVVLGEYLRRTSSALAALALVSTCMLAWNPFILRDDVSFQLSFLATLGIILCAERYTRYWTRHLGVYIGSSLAVTCAALLFTMPWVMYVFGTVSIVAPLSNVLVGSFVPVATVMTFVTGALAVVPIPGVSYVAFVCAWIAQVALFAIMTTAEVCARIPYASVSLALPVWGVVAAWCAALIHVCTSPDSASADK